VKLVRILGVLAAVVLALGIFYGVLAESGEVVVLETRDAAGAVHETRLWVVDYEGSAWLRTGEAQAPWLARLRANPEVAVTRGGERREYRAGVVEDAATREQINTLELQKYGWRESVLRVAGMDPAGATPIRLEPAS
jgi:hypothetical protein